MSEGWFEKRKSKKGTRYRLVKASGKGPWKGTRAEAREAARANEADGRCFQTAARSALKSLTSKRTGAPLAPTNQEQYE